MSDVAVRLAAALSPSYRIEVGADGRPPLLGQGGMATVYLAEDLKHDRKVAIKVLRPELAAVIGAERFLREIKTIATLQHPHILGLIDSGEVNGTAYYVMPFVEGESLRDRLSCEKLLPVADAVRLATEVASALDYAHRHGVIHRDIKPENILLHDGRALVADFGIALAVSSAGGSRMTETGMSLGTPHYMSPEQAMGEREITARSDVYALGCVTYEMLTGEPPFTGPTAQAIVARVVTETPRPLLPQRHTIPPHVEAAVLMALEKLPADRFATAAQFAEALANATLMPRTAAVTAGPAVRVSGRGRRLALLAIGGLVLAAAGLLAGRGLSAPSEEAIAFQILPGPDHRLGMPGAANVAVSPDGRTIAYVGRGPRGRALYLRPLGDFNATPVAGTGERLYGDPVFSADGQSVIWNEDNGAINRSPVSGGAVTAVAPNSTCCTLATTADGGVLIQTVRGLELVPATGPSTLLAPLPNGTTAQLLPDARTILYAGSVTRRIEVLDLKTGRSEPVEGLPAGVDDLTWADGWLLYQTGTTLSAVRFDAGGHRAGGQAIVLLTNVRVGANGGFREIQSAFGGGTLALVPAAGNNRIAVVDRAGREVLLADTTGVFHRPRFSPDGRRISLDITRNDSRDVWVYDFDQRTMTRVTFEPNGHDAIWAPDGRSILYNAAVADTLNALLSRRTDGSATVDTVARDLEFASPEALTVDGRFVLSYALAIDTKEDAWLVDRATGAHRVLLGGNYDEGGLALSRDGRWLAWASNESGRYEIYVRALEGGPRIQVSTGGGREAVWNPRGDELFYRVQSANGASLMAARLSTTPLRVIARDTLFAIPDYEEADPHANYDVSPDGTRFVFIRQLMPNEIRVIRNWQALLERR
ncbi:MAG: protein kinase domain-containing protein [Gemmatimonadales bacterium]